MEDLLFLCKAIIVLATIEAFSAGEARHRSAVQVFYN